jgi:hypothetical protein
LIPCVIPQCIRHPPRTITTGVCTGRHAISTGPGGRT